MKRYVQRMLGIGLLLGFFVVGCSPSRVEQAEVVSEGETPAQELTSEDSDAERHDRIAYIGEDGNIYTIDPYGNERRAITEDANLAPGSGESLRSYSSPTWAPGTGDLAYIAVRDTEEGRQFAIEVSQRGQSEREIFFQRPSESPFYLFWAPSGETLSFLASSVAEEELSLWLAERDGDARVVDRGQPYYWDWTPDGDRFLSHVGGSSESNPGGAHVSLLLDRDDPWGDVALELLPFQAPAISPDGQSVLLAADTQEDPAGLILMGLDGSFQSWLADLPGSVAFGWSASGDHIAYVTAPGPTGALHGDLVVVSVEDPSGPARVLHQVHGVTAFLWSPVEERLAYFIPTLPPSGEDQRISTSRQEQRLFLELYIFDVAWNEPRLVASFLPTLDFLEILPFFDQYQRSVTFWSPDAEAFVFSASLAGGESVIYTVEVTGPAAPVEIARGTLAFWSRK